jgi:hypothetical protein
MRYDVVKAGRPSVDFLARELMDEIHHAQMDERYSNARA